MKLFSTIKSKLITSIILLVLLPGFIFTFYSYSSTTKTFEVNMREALSATKLAYDNAIEGLKTKGMSYAEFFSNDTAIKEAISYAQMTEDNTNLLGILEKYYKTLDLNNIEFTAKDGIVMARGHLPEKFNDNKSEFPFTQKMNEAQEKRWDYEKGKSGITLKFGAPVAVEDEYAGFVGYGYYLDNKFLQSVKDVVGAELFVILKEGEKIVASTKDDISAENIDKGYLAASLNGDEKIELEKGLGDRIYSWLYLPILDAEKNIFGTMCVLKDITREIEARNNNLIFSVSLMAFAGILALIVGFLITRSITKPINHVVDRLKDIAEGEGDLTMRLDTDTQGEIGALATWFNRFVEKLQNTIQKIAAGTETLSSSSTELSAISQQMSTGAEQASEKSTAVASAAEEMSANMSSVAAAAEQASSNANMIATSTEEMTSTINEIAKNSETARAISSEAVSKAKHSVSRVGDLGNAAQEISKVTKTITEISEQTNLLALNATIEAARAGEAGKGFAVVANEIKELARQTAESTDEIRKQIEGIQQSISVAISDIEQVPDVIDRVNEIVSTIATSVEEQSATTQEIANNVAQASKGIQEVTENVNQSSSVSVEIAKDLTEVNQAAGDMANSSSQVNLSAQDLSTLAEQLTDLAGQFKV